MKTLHSKWKLLENRKKFIDQLAIKLNIKTPSDWGKIDLQQIKQLGGSAPLLYYKDVEWKNEWFTENKTKNYTWNSINKQRQILDKIAKKLNVKHPSDWGKINVQKVIDLGASGLLRKHYNDSLFSCLQSVYCEIEWKKEWFRKRPRFEKVFKSYWKSMENRKNFLDESAVKLNIKKPQDWGKVTLLDIDRLKGTSLLANYYNNSLFACLQSVYKDINWKREWFKISRYPRDHWNSVENCRQFLEELARSSNINANMDWRKITPSLIKSKGGAGLLHKYKGSIQYTLRSIYSFCDWSDLHYARIERTSTEKYLKTSIQGIFPAEQVIARHFFNSKVNN